MSIHTPLHRRQFLSRTLAAGLLPALPGLHGAQAAQPWPSRPIKWIVPFLAGTAPDTTARVIHEAVGRELGQPVIIENRGGVGGNLGARIAAKAAPDGYTWIYSSAPMAASMHMYKAPGYDALKDFEHVMGLTSSDIVLIVNAASDIRTLDDLVARARQAPGKLDYASGGVGTPSHLGVELLLSTVNVQATHVPYKGASEIVNAVMGRQVAFGAPIFSVAYANIQAGKLRALAVAGPRRNPKLPQVPTLAELGVDGVELMSWGGVSVPVGTPEPIVTRMRAAFGKALRQPAVIAALEEQGGNVAPQDAESYRQAFTKEMGLTAAMMKKVRLEPM
ncbi:Bug family tripartite tricarboxylate transporter substrate binding protein [Comamonas endophytica]|uniref:Tripartite tricarboxylate transporter substrate binding protein n=1 Tax=Comamonas endophytica TaxID=2949090 RepID=A0ABY6GET0_9BURK|nr:MULTISPECIES: tripartite tricarboxylate transporter substrate binding protein [unclassified Acidovorax]MCD2513250.1 tripartite tricarboxylate transporter substrate binding protein [Acidovorax sp. D4N7]UYG53406.1 tripartite tricarboxylate transporter substrate binding protein [Acidovorax sp. 5MLIR]